MVFFGDVIGRVGEKLRPPVESPHIEGYTRLYMQNEPQKYKGFGLLTLASLNISKNLKRFLSYD